ISYRNELSWLTDPACVPCHAWRLYSTEVTMVGHDASYKMLFSHLELIQDLLRGFLPREWQELLDLNSLEKMNSSHVTEGLRSRHSDVIWRLRHGDDWLYLYLLLEFQSSIDRMMAL